MGTGKLIEGVWDCKGCGTVRILGRYRECPHCGKVRDSNVKFYMSDKKMYVPEEQAKTISRNPDWVCCFCDCLNPDTTDICKSCGASRTAENKDYFENRKEKDKEQAKKDERIADLSKTHETVITERETSFSEEASSPIESYSHDEDYHSDDYHDVSSDVTTNDSSIDTPERNYSWFESAKDGVVSFVEDFWPFILGGLAVIIGNALLKLSVIRQLMKVTGICQKEQDFMKPEVKSTPTNKFWITTNIKVVRFPNNDWIIMKQKLLVIVI